MTILDELTLPLYTAALLGQTAYGEGLTNDPYKDEDLLDLLAYAESTGAACGADIVATWSANWEKMQKEIVKH